MYFAAAFGREQVAVFDSTGRLAGSIGRAGEGPGEFRAVVDVLVGSADSLFLVDVRRQVAVFSPEGKYVRTIQLPGNYIRGVTLADNRLAVNMPIYRSSGRVPYAIHILSPEGVVENSFDHISPSGNSIAPRLIVTGADKRTIWSTAPDVYGYVLSHWFTTGDSSQVVTVKESPWFPDDAPGPPQDVREVFSKPPTAAIQPAFALSNDRILVLLHVADADWKVPERLLERTRHWEEFGRGYVLPGGMADMPTAGEWTNMLDTVVEIVDLDVPGIRASQRFDQVLHPIGGTRLLWSERQDSVDVVTVDVWTLGTSGCEEPATTSTSLKDAGVG